MVGKTNTTKKKASTNWEYSAAPESTDHISLMSNYDLFIAGKFTKPKEGTYFNSINPANETSIAKVASAGKADVNKAVAAAKVAYENVWKGMDPSQRGKYIYRIARLIQERAREFAVIESLDEIGRASCRARV